MIFLQISVWFNKFKKKNSLQIIAENIIYKCDSFEIKIGLILKVKISRVGV